MLRGISNAVSKLAPTIATRRLSGSPALRHQDDFFTIPRSNRDVVCVANTSDPYVAAQKILLLSSYITEQHGFKGELDRLDCPKSEISYPSLTFSADRNQCRDLAGKIQGTINTIPKMDDSLWKKPKG